VVLVAGGIGVTPMLAIMRDMHDRGAPLADKVSLHWSVPQLSLYLAFSNGTHDTTRHAQHTRPARHTRCSSTFSWNQT
jgi:ferredoxin-NADP reductase